MYFLPRLDVTGIRPVWLVEIFPVTSMAFRKMIRVRIEGVLVSGFGDCAFLVDLKCFWS